MNPILTIIAISIPLIIIAVYLLRYLDGYYTIISTEIIKEGNIIEYGKKIGEYYVIKTIYQNNRITIRSIDI